MSRKNKPFPEPYKDWIHFVNLRIEIFYNALDLLHITDEKKKNEKDISEALYPKLRIVSFKHKEKPAMPKFDAIIGAVSDDELTIQSINKRPDFSYSLVNSYAESEEEHEINLHIECKRIGNNDPSWNLNMNYITDGIDRFDSLSHEYGKYAHDGVMIGYIIDSTKEEIQKVINEKLPENIEKLNFRTKNKVENISTKFKRKNVKPFDFIMHHIWADYA